MPGGSRGVRAPVVGGFGVHVQVEVLRLVDELEIRQRRGAAVDHERVEPLPRRSTRALDLCAERVPAPAVARRVAAERRRKIRVLQLERVARHDPHPRRPVGEQRREAVHVVLDDHVGPRAVQDVLELPVAVDRAVDQRGPDGFDERLELLDRRLAELGGGLGHEVDPELAGVLVALGRRCEVDQILFEAERLQATSPRRLGREDDPVPSLLEHLADADAVVRRPVGALGHEDDREPLAPHGGPNPTGGPGGVMPRAVS